MRRDDTEALAVGGPYVALNCATTPSVNPIHNPARPEWQPVVKVEHYRLVADSVEHPVVLRESGNGHKTP